VLCSEPPGKKETQARFSCSRCFHVAHQSFHYPQFLHFLLSTMFSTPTRSSGLPAHSSEKKGDSVPRLSAYRKKQPFLTAEGNLGQIL